MLERYADGHVCIFQYWVLHCRRRPTSPGRSVRRRRRRDVRRQRRYYGHHVGDIQRTYYRSKEEEDHWKTERDPIILFGTWLKKHGLATDADLERIRADTQREVEAGVQFALEAPFPDASEVSQHVYA